MFSRAPFVGIALFFVSGILIGDWLLSIKPRFEAVIHDGRSAKVILCDRNCLQQPDRNPASQDSKQQAPDAAANNGSVH